IAFGFLDEAPAGVTRRPFRIERNGPVVIAHRRVKVARGFLDGATSRVSLEASRVLRDQFIEDRDGPRGVSITECLEGLFLKWVGAVASNRWGRSENQSARESRQMLPNE